MGGMGGMGGMGSWEAWEWGEVWIANFRSPSPEKDGMVPCSPAFSFFALPNGFPLDTPRLECYIIPLSKKP